MPSQALIQSVLRKENWVNFTVHEVDLGEVSRVLRREAKCICGIGMGLKDNSAR